jgi:hypothetical protein
MKAELGTNALGGDQSIVTGFAPAMPIGPGATSTTLQVVAQLQM